MLNATIVKLGLSSASPWTALVTIFHLGFNVRLRFALSEQLKAPLRQVDHFSFVVFLKLGLAIHLAICDGPDLLNNVLSFAD